MKMTSSGFSKTIFRIWAKLSTRIGRPYVGVMNYTHCSFLTLDCTIHLLRKCTIITSSPSAVCKLCTACLLVAQVFQHPIRAEIDAHVIVSSSKSAAHMCPSTKEMYYYTIHNNVSCDWKKHDTGETVIRIHTLLCTCDTGQGSPSGTNIIIMQHFKFTLSDKWLLKEGTN